MAEISEAKLAANRENAKKSTGPRTKEGKERSRQNALKHGMASGVVVAEEMRGEAEERIKSWTEELRPQTRAEAWLVERAAVDAVRADAAVRCERARLEERLRNNTLYAKADGIAEAGVTKLGDGLLKANPEQVPAFLVQLRGTRAGCEWLLRRWHDLGRRHRALGYWGEYEFRLARCLAGGEFLELNDPGRIISDRFARLCVDYMLSHPGCLRREAPMAESLRRACWDIDDMVAADGEPESPESIYAANRRLAAFIVDHVLELEDRLETLQQAETLDDEMAAERALVDFSADGKLLHRYETDLLRRVHQALDQLARIRKSPPADEAAPAQPVPPEPGRPESCSNAPLRPETPPPNEPKPPASPSRSLRPIRIPAPSRPSRPALVSPLVKAVTPRTGPSKLLAALADSPEGRLRAERDRLLRGQHEAMKREARQETSQ